MVPNSLLENYIDVVNENLKKMGKKFSENIFRLAENFWFEIFLIFSKHVGFLENFRIQIP